MMATDTNAPATTASDQASAESIFAQTLQSYGFDQADTQSLMTWATGQITGKNTPNGLPVPEAQVGLDLMKTPEFAARFPGIIQQQQQGGPVTSVADYLSYEQQIAATARAAGLPPGFVTPQTIGNLIANHVDPQEFSDRVTKAYQAVAEENPEVKQYFKQTFGVDEGHLASYFLDPEHALPLLQAQATAAQIGGAGMEAGFRPISGAQAMELARAGVDQQQALAGFKNVSGLLPLATGLLGHVAGSPETVTQSQLVGAQFLGDQPDVRAVQLAQESRKAPFSGGGGYGQTQRGTAAGGVGDVGARSPQP